MQGWISLLRWRYFVARRGGPQGIIGVLFCVALPVVPFGLLLASALGDAGSFWRRAAAMWRSGC